ncbi:hypothetical protein ES703_87332 [subsurface metagenome]
MFQQPLSDDILFISKKVFPYGLEKMVVADEGRDVLENLFYRQCYAFSHITDDSQGNSVGLFNAFKKRN